MNAIFNSGESLDSILYRRKTEAEVSVLEFVKRLLKLVLPRRILVFGRVSLRGEGAEELLGSFSLIAYSKLMTAFCTAASNNILSIFGRHALTESVLVRALFVTWLKCAFHESGCLINSVIQKDHKYKEYL